jgi:HAD superfamily hydrolase (TIGR01490 family)
MNFHPHLRTELAVEVRPAAAATRAPETDVAKTTPTSGDTTPRAPVAAFFDLDKTIIAGSSTLAFSGPLRDRGLIGRRALLRSGYAQLLLMVSGADADFMERMRSRISALCTGWDAAEVRSVIERSIHEILPSMIYTEAVELISEHREHGHHIVVVSASGMEMVGPIADALGADVAMGTRMEVADGRYTGKIDFYCYGEGKARAARTLADERGYRLADCYAYSDSITDLPLLEVVGHPRAVNPDRALRRVALRRGWPVLNFVAPVPLRTRMGRRARSLLPAGRPRFMRRAPGPIPLPALLALAGLAGLAGLAAARGRPHAESRIATTRKRASG